MRRNFLHREIAYRPAEPGEAERPPADVVIYYDDHTATELDEGLRVVLNFINRYVVSAEDYAPGDEIILYSDTWTSESLATYFASVEADVAAIEIAEARAYWQQDLDEMRASAKRFVHRPFADCPDEQMKKRFEKLASEYQRPNAAPQLYHRFGRGSRRLYEETILSES